MTNWTAKFLMTAGLLSAAWTVGCAEGRVGIYASAPPPPVRVESFGPSPGPGYVYLKGYWGYNGGRYNWVPGRWDRPPAGRRHWEDGRWEKHGNRYEYREGRWR